MGTLLPQSVNATQELRVGGSVPVLAVWGGIGFSRRPLKDLRDLYSLHRGNLCDFVQHCSKLLRSLVEDAAGLSEPHEAAGEANDADARWVQHDLVGWLEQQHTSPSRKTPALPQTASTAVTTILQMSRYVLLARRQGMTPGELARHFTAFAGHSVGITVAMGMASADSWASLYEQADMVLSGTYFAEQSVASAWEQTIPLDPTAISRFVQRGEGAPTPMLSITGIAQSRLVLAMETLNVALSPERQLHLALVNGSDSFVVAGGPEGLVRLCDRIRGPSSSSVHDGTPSPGQTPADSVSMQFVPSTAPFHTPHMKGATLKLASKGSPMKRIVFDQNRLLVPVLGLDDLLKQGNVVGQQALATDVVDLIISTRVDWPATMHPVTSRWQVLDFGPGGFNGIGLFIQRTSRQTYVVYPTGAIARQAGRATPQGRHPTPEISLLAPTPSESRTYSHISFEARPVSKTEIIDKPVIATAGSRFTEAFGLPRVLVAGMTPTSCDVDFVAAAMCAGFYAEFATGGYHDAPTLAAALRRLATLIPAGRFITVNVVYANPKGLGWMIPQLGELVRKGLPIGGLVIGAGTPSASVAAEYVDVLQLGHIGFKPATLESIHHVLDIARQHPTLPVMLQWTGGRAGGHHSTQDFHQPILASYEAIRNVPNIVLVAGSGFGDADDAWPYLSGSWAQIFGREPAPFDAVLIGTCATITLESKLSLAAKQAVVESEGLEDGDWQDAGSGTQGRGGVVSILSHMGEPMHVVASRGMRLWAELDRTLFNKPKNALLGAVADRRAELISQLNSHHQKVWFCWGYAAGGPVDDLQDMTYLDVLRRLVELMHPAHYGGWTHVSYQLLFKDFMARTLERFGGILTPASVAALAGPERQLGLVAERIPGSRRYYLSVEDADYFVSLCKKRGRKPVPFVPVLDADFVSWFKKDPLWAAENLERTYHRDVGRLCVLAGPVAVRRCKESNVPLAEFLRRIHQGIQDHEAKAGLMPPGFHPCVMANDGDWQLPPWISGSKDLLRIDSGIATEALNDDQWFLLIGKRLGLWGIRALGTRKIITDKKAHTNPIRCLFAPRPGSEVRIVPRSRNGGTGEFEAALCNDVDRVHLYLDGNIITASISSECTRDQSQQRFTLKFEYSETVPFAPLSEMVQDRQSRLAGFYQATLFGSSKVPEKNRNPLRLTHDATTVTQAHFTAWQRATDGQGEDASSSHHLGPNGEVPIEFSTIVVMDATWRHLLAWDLDTSALLHQRTKVTLRHGMKTLCIGDEVSITSVLMGMSNTAAGIEARFVMTCTRLGQDFLDLVYHFTYVGQSVPRSWCFETRQSTTWSLQLHTEADVQALRTRPWFRPVNHEGKGVLFSPSDTLVFDVQRDVLWDSGADDHVAKTRGFVWAGKDGKDKKDKGLCAHIYQDLTGSDQTDLVAAYLQRRASPASEKVPLPSTPTLMTSKVVTPDNSIEYARVIGDLNPIHTSPAIARLAGFSGPIYHGNHTAALVLQTIRRTIPQARSTTLRHYDFGFPAVVQPGYTLWVTVKHVAMESGGAVLSFSARAGKDGQDLVLMGEIVLEASPTVYLFTGQGSQFAGMGLDLASRSAASRRVWAEADAYFEKNWGFLMTSTVRNNPRRITVNFSGSQGQYIREKYLGIQAMFASNAPPGYERELFAGLHARSRSYTFHHEDGLLSMTQFAQPALVVFEKAAVEHLHQLSRVPRTARFAGHSLGEFAALSAMTDVLPLAAVLQTVFIRGTLMQAAVSRDDRGRSGYGMVAVDPSRIGSGCQESHILALVQAVATHTGLLLEMVNFNVRGRQYVIAGDKRCLELLQRVTDEAQENSLFTEQNMADAIERHSDIVDLAGAYDVSLKRGQATVPLLGIDVPFHSTLLANMTGLFRNTLKDAIDPSLIQSQDLVGRWVPNLTGKPFSIDKEYVQLVAGLTASPYLEKLLDRMP